PAARQAVRWRSFDLRNGLAFGDLLAYGDEQLAHDAGGLGLDGDFHLHRLDDDEGGTGVDGGAFGGFDGGDQAGDGACNGGHGGFLQGWGLSTRWAMPVSMRPATKSAW